MNDRLQEPVETAVNSSSASASATADGLGLPERYVVEKEIARGGMGIVYACRHAYTGQKLAIKVLLQHVAAELVNIQRFRQEATAAGKLSHPNIVRLVDFGITETGTLFMVMDYAEGQSLKSRLEAKGVLEPAEFFDIFIQLCDGLAHAHKQKVVHRDIKPSNISISIDNEGRISTKILDFGVARIEEDKNATLTKTGEVVGSPLYMSPEQGLGRRCDARSDIYSLGCMMFQCLVGSVPFEGQNAVDTIFLHVSNPVPTLKSRKPSADFPDSFEQIVARCLNKDPEQRYQDAEQLRLDLIAARDGGVNWKTRYHPRWHRRLLSNKRTTVAASIVLLCLGFSGVFLSNMLEPKWQKAADAAAASSGKVSNAELIKMYTRAFQLADQENAALSDRIGLRKTAAHLAFADGDIVGSAEILEDASAAATHPQDRADLFADAGNLRTSAGQLEAAAKDYQAAATLETDYPKYMYARTPRELKLDLGAILYKLHRYEAAVQTLKEADYGCAGSASDKVAGDLNRWLGRALVKVGEKKEAMVYFEKARDIYTKLKGKFGEAGMEMLRASMSEEGLQFSTSKQPSAETSQ